MDERKYRLADTQPLHRGARPTTDWLGSRAWYEAAVTPFDASPQPCRLLRMVIGAATFGGRSQNAPNAMADLYELDERELLELGVTRADSLAAPMAYSADQSRGC